MPHWCEKPGPPPKSLLAGPGTNDMLCQYSCTQKRSKAYSMGCVCGSNLYDLIHVSCFSTAVTSHLFCVARPTCSAVCWSWVRIRQHWMVMAVHQNLWRNVLDKLCANKFYKLSWLRSRRSLGIFGSVS